MNFEWWQLLWRCDNIYFLGIRCFSATLWELKGNNNNKKLWNNLNFHGSDANIRRKANKCPTTRGKYTFTSQPLELFIPAHLTCNTHREKLVFTVFPPFFAVYVAWFERWLQMTTTFFIGMSKPHLWWREIAKNGVCVHWREWRRLSGKTLTQIASS